MESEGKFVVVYSSEQERFVTPHGLYLGEKVPAVETPERTRVIIQKLLESGQVEVVEPRAYPIEPILAVHDADYVDFIKTVNSTPIDDPEIPEGKPAPVAYPFTFPYVRPGLSKHRSRSIIAQMGRYVFDLSTPINSDTYPAAYKSVEVALTGADMIANKEHKLVYSLCRPPGHHAQRNLAGGFCFFNNAAIAVQYLLGHPTAPAKRVAILDLDFHHGNGTQDIFYETDKVLFVSLHHTPHGAYPYFSGFEDETGAGQGEGFNINYPLEAGTDEDTYTATLNTACDEVAKYGADYLIVSLGFDTFCEDLISNFKLTEPYYETMAAVVSARLPGLPALIIGEGGYKVDKLGALALNFLRGWKS
jgi:acetoin utilization deacetylase AcuC-like enzyme